MRFGLAVVVVSVAVGCGRAVERPANPTCVAPERVTGGGEFAFEQRLSDKSLDQPVTLTWHPSVPDTWYVAEKSGRIVRFHDDGTPDVEEALNIVGQVTTATETGLIGFAFHPDFADNGQIYVHYTADDGDLISRIVRFTSTDGGLTFGNEELILDNRQPFGNHNGGHLAFGPDGYLYIAFGDGGGSGDPLGNAQDLQSLHGKMLRIDVDGGSPYAIPPDNPFATGGGLPEIYAWGLRNPWRWSFDPVTGDLWLGDVGQNDREEVDLVVKGGNYGWSITEGELCFPEEADCDRAGLIEPILTYETGDFASVVGGIVYRGTGIPGLEGHFLANDFHSGRTWALLEDGTGAKKPAATGPEFVVHWTEGPDGEAWAITHDGEIYTLVADGEPPTGGPPALLSQTGCLDPADPTQMVEGAIPFEIQHPFWSDDAAKRRWLAIPDGTQIAIGPDEDLELPIGTVLIKEFQRAGKRIETRLMVRHEDGGWAGYAYQWRPDGSDAELLQAQTEVQVAGPWTIPSRTACLGCHTDAAGGSLSLELGQLGTGALELARMGVLAGLDPKKDEVPVWPGVSEGGSVESRARTYLHVNCSSCHRPEGGTPAELDFRREGDSRVALGICVEPLSGDLGLPNTRIIEPGDPDRSLLYLRMTRRDADGMPPLGSHRVDEEGAELIAAWIRSIEGCNE